MRLSRGENRTGKTRSTRPWLSSTFNLNLFFFFFYVQNPKKISYYFFHELPEYPIDAFFSYSQFLVRKLLRRLRKISQLSNLITFCCKIDHGLNFSILKSDLGGERESIITIPNSIAALRTCLICLSLTSESWTFTSRSNEKFSLD